ncbi:hypothetical protein I551_5960 [Mycobacterium ulcerans str. Harvey]|uniref:Uncharacterized protein n=1 Tax=Mycobacterium ulcerans str. Harvey TaxID=1299332 RepID=A0ABP3A7Z0_MYCUL|nr:hypothetical protein I551_5960 [Mycobacterium ulcerans str. Harvey]
MQDVLGSIELPGQPHILRLDGDPAFAFDIHPVQVLGPHRALVNDPVNCSIRSASVDFPWSM